MVQKKASSKDGNATDALKKSMEIVQKLGKQVQDEFIGDKLDRVKVNALAHKYEGDGLEIYYKMLHFISGPNKKDSKGYIRIHYKGKRVLNAKISLKNLETEVMKFVNYPSWERKLEEIYSTISSS